MKFLKFCLCLLCFISLMSACKKDTADLEEQVATALVVDQKKDQNNNSSSERNETEGEEESHDCDGNESDDSEGEEDTEEEGEEDTDEEGDEEEDESNTDEGEEDEDGENESDEGEEDGESESDEEGEDDAEEGDIFEVSAILKGTDESEKLQGFDSDDVITGGAGADLFPFTRGMDIITDFNPAEDMIDVGDFARGEEGLSFLNSLAAIAANSSQQMVEGVSSLVIDVDGDLGDATTTLIGITIDDLNADNVFFGLDGESIPPLEFTHIAEFLVTYNNCDVVLFPAHDLNNHPIDGQIVQKGCN